jgi:hypothetical protein
MLSISWFPRNDGGVSSLSHERSADARIFRFPATEPLVHLRLHPVQHHWLCCLPVWKENGTRRSQVDRNRADAVPVCRCGDLAIVRLRHWIECGGVCVSKQAGIIDNWIFPVRFRTLTISWKVTNVQIGSERTFATAAQFSNIF